ncbi:hypothetical protein SeMB42_g07077 [Synchytrium endobioticum]|uniref:Uncharacterized protein n=1 Tax=Synchytrium endobioticum TaxID=286115 RepID=A0A507CAT1_9FUNG|nr:hypothetical protein SeMB42_g07077 [Synchytrium endobioticum]
MSPHPIFLLLQSSFSPWLQPSIANLVGNIKSHLSSISYIIPTCLDVFSPDPAIFMTSLAVLTFVGSLVIWLSVGSGLYPERLVQGFLIWRYLLRQRQTKHGRDKQSHNRKFEIHYIR